MDDEEFEQIGWGTEWPEGSPHRFSFMVREPLQDEEQWFPIYRRRRETTGAAED